MHKLAHWALLILAACWAATIPAAETVRFPDYPDVNKAFFRAALQLALDKSGHDYVLAPVLPQMLQGRSIARAMGSGGDIDVLWTMTTRQRETMLLPVRFPVDKGLLGWRIAIVRQDKAEQFARVQTLQDLRYFTAGQEHDWPDTRILRESGLPVMGTDHYESLFRMLAARRFDYFPRGVTEAWAEVDARPGLGLTVERFVVLRYPAAEYFFVTPRKPYLARHIWHGLLRAQADGSFDRLFHAHFDPILQRARLQDRRVIELPNPLIDATKLLPADSPWWYRPLPAPGPAPGKLPLN
ncbi:hypothetical protein [Vogesella alkaliphila]|uniref:Transporter substrate-binding domain-containing protein n=1 Tax=Vogesella alkaliphila TaxID=1193621 RepID=A0ABQ2YXE8_9NEIS|nr:hypothetical protein [Vogesella alkaliphila]GGX98563.1 hypothetical protein GCM10011290_28140 [Vogesella alkaliphila]